MPDDHQRWSQWLTAFHDGELAAPHRKRVQEHVSVCPHCQRALAELHRLREMLQTVTVPWATMQSPGEAWQQVANRLERRRPASTASAHWFQWFPPTGLLILNVVTQIAGTVSLVIMVLSALGLIDLRDVWEQLNRGYAFQANQVLGWLLLRTVAEPLGWGASLISPSPEWQPAADYVLSTVFFGFLGLVISIGYVLSLWLLWRNSQRQAHYGGKHGSH